MARWKRVLRGVAGAAVVVVTAVLIDGCTSFGKAATGERRARMERSPQWSHGHFVNPQPQSLDWWGSLTGSFHMSDVVSPTEPLHMEPVDLKVLQTAPASGLRVTWLGHSTSLIEVDGVRILTDPVWSTRPSPFTWAGPTRWYGPQVELTALPKIDAVVVSHDHYDHFDRETMLALKDLVEVYIVPLGLGAHLEYWGIPPEKIRELDWWETTRVGDVDVVCAPARHASGRFVHDRDATLWGSYALRGPAHRVYFSGDTGLFPGMRTIGDKLGPFDLTMIEVGQYHRAWPDWHLGPEQAVTAHQWVKGKRMLPMHWALFALAFHGWTEPGERVITAAARAEVPLVLARPGVSIEPETAPELTPWWPKLPFETAEQHPVVSTLLD